MKRLFEHFTSRVFGWLARLWRSPLRIVEAVPSPSTRSFARPEHPSKRVRPSPHDFTPSSVIAAKSTLPYVPGLQRFVDPSVHPVVETLQIRAAKALFSALNQSWVPPEYLSYLYALHSPTEALRAFCNEYHIDYIGLRNNTHSSISQLGELTDILIAIHSAKSLLSHSLVDILFDNVKSLSYRDIDAKLTFFTRLSRHKLKIAELNSRYNFSYVTTFIIDKLSDEAIAYTSIDEEADISHHIETIAGIFLDIDALDEWINEKLSPISDDPDISATFRSIREFHFDHLQFATSIDQLNTALDEWEAEVIGLLHEEAADADHTSYERESSDADASDEDDLIATALLELGFHSGEEPSFAEIKSSYRRLMKLYHPDVGATPDIDRTVRLNAAMELLEKVMEK